MSNKKDLFVALMDYEKAFDCANRMSIIKDLMLRGCGSQLTKAIANMYSSTEYFPRLKGNRLGEGIVTKLVLPKVGSCLLFFFFFIC